jgi:hypothetical protein
MSLLKIVWSNPKAERCKRRWHKLACDVGRRRYVVEELVTRGDLPCWAQAVALEVVRGGRAA